LRHEELRDLPAMAERPEVFAGAHVVPFAIEPCECVDGGGIVAFPDDAAALESCFDGCR